MKMNLYSHAEVVLLKFRERERTLKHALDCINHLTQIHGTDTEKIYEDFLASIIGECELAEVHVEHWQKQVDKEYKEL